MTSVPEELRFGPHRDFAPVPRSIGPVNLLRSSLKGSLAKIASQILNLLIRIAFIAILARHIDHSDFGLFAMAIVFMGALDIIASSGFTPAIVSSSSVNQEQLSKVFAYCLIVAIAIACLCVISAPLIARFYNDPRTTLIIILLIPGFILNCLGSVPIALLQREMRFVQLAHLEVLAGLCGSALGIVLALIGCGYWALVAAAIVWPAVSTIGSWLLSGWLPSWPRRATSVFPMVRFAATFTLNSLVVYAAYNFDKVLLGRAWGASALGVYGRASQLCTMSSSIIGQATAPIALSALSRLKNEPGQLRRYFCDYYMIVNAVTVPISVLLYISAADIVDTLLGEGWSEAHAVLRLLAPTVLILGMMNSIGPLMLATGHERRSLLLALVIAPVCLAAYAIGLPYGPEGVARAYSIALALWLVPHLLWCFRGMSVSIWDAFAAVLPSLGAGLAAAALVALVREHLFHSEIPLVNLIVVSIVMGAGYAVALLAILHRTGKREELMAIVRRNG